MRLMTLNTHSRPGELAKSIPAVAEQIIKEEVDVIALQEVNQSRSARLAREEELQACRYRAPKDVTLPIGCDNFALHLAGELARRGLVYEWCYLPVKLGYEQYDEGLSLFWRGFLQDVRVIPLSTTQDYQSWRRRMALGIRLRQGWFYSVHTSRWDDDEEPFSSQWRRLLAGVCRTEHVFLMGDFNCPADISGQGYERMMADGWRDLFTQAQSREGYRTACGAIDGWEDISHNAAQRIDFILSNDQALHVRRARTLFDPDRGEIAVSDHCGVLCEIELTEGGDERDI